MIFIRLLMVVATAVDEAQSLLLEKSSNKEVVRRLVNLYGREPFFCQHTLGRCSRYSTS